MKPQNKLGGKLDDIKKKVAFESSKKVSKIARDSQQKLEAISQDRFDHIEILEAQIVQLLTKLQVTSQALRNEKERAKRIITKVNTDQIKLKIKLARLKEGLTFYKEGKHYEKGLMGYRVLDRGEKAEGVLNDK